MSRQIEPGMKFGMLAVVSKADPYIRKSGKRDKRWNVVCECGNKKAVRTDDLKSGKTTSCSCRKDKLFMERVRRKKPEKSVGQGVASFHALFYTYKRQAAKRGYSFELTEAEFRDMTGSNCTYCGSPPSQKNNESYKQYGVYVYNGVDRVDNSRGYSMDNCVPCCGICNRAKGTLLMDKFLDWLNKIKEWNK